MKRPFTMAGVLMTAGIVCLPGTTVRAPVSCLQELRAFSIRPLNRDRLQHTAERPHMPPKERPCAEELFRLLAHGTALSRLALKHGVGCLELRNQAARTHRLENIAAGADRLRLCFVVVQVIGREHHHADR
ncbi:MAG: hypothetical protein JWN14_4161 [Chthonomonadales bacterium]|nr:hypothetical protein [Chthonomonadales bacterium]